MWLVRSTLALTFALGASLAQGEPVPVLTCDPNESDTLVCTRTLTRDADVWFGTISTVGNVAPAQFFIFVTDGIQASPTLVLNIVSDPSVDPRVLDSIASLPALPFMAGVEYVLGDDENFPAEASLLAAFASAFGPGPLTLLPGLTTSAIYTLASVSGPELVGEDLAEVSTFYNAGITYHELNAIWGSGDVASVPEPGTVGLLAIALGGLALLSRRRRHA